MRGGKGLAIGGSIAFIAVMLLVSYSVETGFNPYPEATTITGKSTCSSGAEGCPGFKIDGANLSVNIYQDITSQELTLKITPRGSVPVASVSLFLDNISLGVVEGPFVPGVATSVSAGVPTTIVLEPGSTHEVVVEGVYVDPAGAVTGTYWESVSVVAD